MFTESTRLCACGCGTVLPSPKYPSSRVARFINRHQNRARMPPAALLAEWREYHRAAWAQAGIAYGLCMCGCGEATPLSTQSYVPDKLGAGDPFRYLPGHQRRVSAVPACGYTVEDRGHDTPCWVWALGLNKGGYGKTFRDGKHTSAHAAFWTDVHGPVPTGLELDHLCRVRACCNPVHLEPVTTAVNIQRRDATKLSPDDVLAIRASPLTHAALAAQFGVCRSTISNVRARKTWRDIT